MPALSHQLNLSVPQFSHFWNGEIKFKISTHMIIACSCEVTRSHLANNKHSTNVMGYYSWLCLSTLFQVKVKLNLKLVLYVCCLKLFFLFLDYQTFSLNSDFARFTDQKTLYSLWLLWIFPRKSFLLSWRNFDIQRVTLICKSAYCKIHFGASEAVFL